ncbi:hypothetical protein DFS34DRAFT_632371 [Phlyctochytrium arcticum]|nr:hypothetical protein DFS34DRAFT_632371 [Phlyctochytrium arcticum]
MMLDGPTPVHLDLSPLLAHIPLQTAHSFLRLFLGSETPSSVPTVRLISDAELVTEPSPSSSSPTGICTGIVCRIGKVAERSGLAIEGSDWRATSPSPIFAPASGSRVCGVAENVEVSGWALVSVSESSEVGDSIGAKSNSIACGKVFGLAAIVINGPLDTNAKISVPFACRFHSVVIAANCGLVSLPEVAPYRFWKSRNNFFTLQSWYVYEQDIYRFS